MADRQRTEHLEQLEERVNRRVRETIDEIRAQVRERLRQAAEQIGEVAEGLGETELGMPESFLPREELAPLTEEAEAGGRLGGELVEALAAVDRAGGQSELLDALAREAGRFASRTAVLVTREEGAELWSSHGWEGPAELTLDYAGDGAWSPERFGRGVQALGPGDCGALCGRIDAPLPEEGLLVPLVLRDRLAALVYADRTEDAPPLRAEAIQVLAYAAALALETLPFRERSSTPTLASGEGADEALPLWSAAAGAEAAAGAPAESGLGAAEADALPAPGEEGLEEGHGPEAGVTGGDEIPDAALAGAGLAPGGLEDASGGAWQLDEGAEPSLDLPRGFDLDEVPSAEAPEPPAWEATAPVEVEVEAEGQEEAVFEPPGPAEELEASPADFEVPVEEEPTGERAEEEAWAEGWSEPEPPAPEPWGPSEEPTVVEPPPVETAAEEAEERPEEEARPEAAEPEATAPEPETPVAEEEPEAQAGAGEAEPGALAGGSVEVRPPTDVEGPGRAFSGGVRATEGDPRHEEARRLARLLVSEIRLYNEEEVEAGRRTGDVYDRLKEDIDRSRQMYEERVDPEVRESTDYFYQELVRNLGGGDSKALGI